MMQQIANFIVDHDPMMVLRRTHDTVRYIQWAWNKDHGCVRSFGNGSIHAARRDRIDD